MPLWTNQVQTPANLIPIDEECIHKINGNNHNLIIK